MKCCGPFFIFSLAFDSGPLGRVLTGLALTLKAPGSTTQTQAHSHIHMRYRAGAKYQLDCPSFLCLFQSHS